MIHDIQGLLEFLEPNHHIEDVKIVSRSIVGLKTFYAVTYFGRGKSQPSACGRYDGMAIHKRCGQLLGFSSDMGDESLLSSCL